MSLKYMGSLKSEMKKNENNAKNSSLIIVDDITLDETVNIDMSHLLLEGQDHFSKVPGTSYTYRIDKPRGIPGPGNLKHIHLYAR